MVPERLTNARRLTFHLGPLHWQLHAISYYLLLLPNKLAIVTISLCLSFSFSVIVVIPWYFSCWLLSIWRRLVVRTAGDYSKAMGTRVLPASPLQNRALLLTFLSSKSTHPAESQEQYYQRRFVTSSLNSCSIAKLWLIAKITRSAVNPVRSPAPIKVYLVEIRYWCGTSVERSFVLAQDVCQEDRPIVFQARRGSVGVLQPEQSAGNDSR